jgi:predicted RNA methylase
MSIDIKDINKVIYNTLSEVDESKLTGKYYKGRLANGSLISGEDERIIEYIRDNFASKKDVIFEPGCGIGQVSLALGVFGFKAIGADPDRKRHASSVILKKSLDKKFGKINVSFLKKYYPRVTPKATLLVINNFVGTHIIKNEDEIIKSFAKYPNLILNIKLFGMVRNTKQQEELLEKICKQGFKAEKIFKSIYFLEKIDG